MTTTQLSEIVDDLVRNRFFGSLELKFEAGQVVLLRKTETIKAPQYGPPGSSRGA